MIRNLLAFVLTSVVCLSWLEVCKLLAKRAFCTVTTSRKLIHIGEIGVLRVPKGGEGQEYEHMAVPRLRLMYGCYTPKMHSYPLKGCIHMAWANGADFLFPGCGLQYLLLWQFFDATPAAPYWCGAVPLIAALRYMLVGLGIIKDQELLYSTSVRSYCLCLLIAAGQINI